MHFEVNLEFLYILVFFSASVKKSQIRISKINDTLFQAFNVMTNSILNSNTLVRVKELVEKYEFDEESYVAEYLDELYNLDQDERPRVHVSWIESMHIIDIMMYYAFPIHRYL